MAIHIVPASDLFNSEELVTIENLVCNLPPLRPLYGPHREFPRFIDLPRDLAERAKLPYDVDAENVLLYF